MKKILFFISALIISIQSNAGVFAEWKEKARDVNFLLISDGGRNGYYDQRTIAENMGRMAEDVWIRCVVAAGDVHHFEGVRSVQDPLWMTNYETIYNHPTLMLPWYPIPGNHEYRGNTQALVDYSQISARWRMPNDYYTQVIKGKKTSVRLVMIDTTPLIDICRDEVNVYPDAHLKDRDKQLAWLDSVLSVAKEDWVLVVGHHPIFADTPKKPGEQESMRKYVDPIIKKHGNVTCYVSGHLHTFQHIQKEDTSIDYIVNTSASQARPSVNKIDGTKFCSAQTGFSLICADKKNLTYYMLDKNGNIIYQINKNK